MRGEVEELWHCDGRGGLRLERVFHAERHVADYAAGELRALGVEADWTALATLVDERELHRLVADATRYRGRLRGDETEIDWDPVRRLPVRLQRRHGDTLLRLERTDVQPQLPAAWTQPAAGIADYVHIDAADFGDMPADPAVRRMQQRDLQAGWRSAHPH
jgi:hypothetical protein